MEALFRPFLPLALLLLILLMALFMRRATKNAKEWSSRTDEQLALNREINRHLDRIATALEGRTK